MKGLLCRIMIYAILTISSFVCAFISGTAGFGGSLLLLPIVSACIGADKAVPILTIAQLIGNIARMLSGWRLIDWKSVGLFSLTSLPLAALGAFGYTILPKAAVTRSIGVFLVILVVFKLFFKKDLPRRRSTLICGCAVTGALSGLCGSGGPIGAAVFLSLGLQPVAYIASEAATATAMHVLKTVVYSKLSGLTLSAIFTGLAMGAAMVVGTYAAGKLIKRLEKDKFRLLTSVLLFCTGIYMIVSGM